METSRESLIKRSLDRAKSKIEFASLFGSCRRGDSTIYSDLDILVVCEKERDKPKIMRDLTELGFKISCEVHANIFSSEIYDKRLKHHDYILASILNDSTFLAGDSEIFLRGKRYLLRKPSLESIEFNRRIGMKLLNEAEEHFGELLKRKNGFSLLSLHDPERELLPGCLRKFHVAFGYLLASLKMDQKNTGISLGHLLSSEEGHLMKDLISAEKKIRYNPYKTIDLEALQISIKKARENLWLLDGRLVPQRFFPL